MRSKYLAKVVSKHTEAEKIVFHFSNLQDPSINVSAVTKENWLLLLFVKTVIDSHLCQFPEGVLSLRRDLYNLLSLISYHLALMGFLVDGLTLLYSMAS